MVRRRRQPRASNARRIIVYIATSADGYIVRPDGDVGWLDRPRPRGNNGMTQFYRSIDTVLLGRKTYDVGRQLGQHSFPGKRNYVFTRSRRRSRVPEVEFIHDDVGDFVAGLRASTGKHVWVVGGAQLIAALLDRGLIDQLIIHLVPVLIGEGIPLIHPRHRAIELDLLSSRAFPDGVIRVHYAVGRTPK
jgi:dihydrofolate reductase